MKAVVQYIANTLRFRHFANLAKLHLKKIGLDSCVGVPLSAFGVVLFDATGNTRRLNFKNAIAR